MLVNYLKVALRSILRNKLVSLINMLGLALALASALLITYYVVDELSYDRQHPHAGRLYRITRNFLNQDGQPSLRLANVAPPIGPLLVNDFPEIEKMARMLPVNTTVTFPREGEEPKSFREPNLFVAEPGILDLFEVNLTEGNKATALNEPYTLILSEPMAQKYFGTTEVTGKQLQVFSNRFEFKVTGVFKPFAGQTHFHPDFLLSFSTLNDSTIYGRRGLETNWGNNSFGTYVLLNEGEDPLKLQSKLPEFLDRHFSTFAIANFGAPADFKASRTTTLQVEKVTDIHLNSHRDDELEPPGNQSNVYLMSLIGIFIVLIACFNFINLSTAQATKRAKEVGIRKVAGAFKMQLIQQHLSESVLLTALSCVLSIGFAALAFQWLNSFTGKSLHLIDRPLILFGALGAAVFVGLCAGLYPAIIISSFRPAVILKGSDRTGKSMLRQTLVTVQFAISIALMIATGITYSQLQFLQAKELGYAKDQIITLPYYGTLNDNFDAFHQTLTEHTAIKEAGRSSRIPTGRLLDSMGAQYRKGDSLENVGVRFAYIQVDHSFMEAYDIPVVAGRNFSKNISTDDSLGFVLNETAARALASEPDALIGQEFAYGGTTGKIIGVVQDFHFESLHQGIVPIVFLIGQPSYNNLSVRVAGNNFSAGLEHLENVWRQFMPDRLFEYTFLSERYRNLYEKETKQSQLFTAFSLLAMFIACLGLFGLATFNALQRIKEVGIRKVLGATLPQLVALLSREIITLVILANLIAWPVAWYFMNEWLQAFAYRIDMPWAWFVIAGVAAVCVALLTVSYQTVKASVANPAHTLRYE